MLTVKINISNEEFCAICMFLGEDYLNFRKPFLQLRGDYRTNWVFCIIVACVDQVDTQLLGIPELIVFHIGSNKSIAAGIPDLPQSAGAAAAAYSDLMYRLSAADIPQTAAI